jgi:hypothetical protein
MTEVGFHNHPEERLDHINQRLGHAAARRHRLMALLNCFSTPFLAFQ